jgi:hypothetical protein
MHRFVATFSLALCAVSFAPAQTADYLDIFMVKVKPERRADFDTLSRKIADANRKAKGDNWIAMQNEYGESNTVFFISPRKNYAAIEQGSKAFMGAVHEVYGPDAWKKMEQDFNSMIVGSRGELRRRRWDLSFNPPKDDESYARLVGEARWLRTMEVRVRQGYQSQFEDRVKEVKTAYEKGSPSWTVMTSQLVAGEPGMIYYFTSMQPSLAGFDSAPELRKLMGEESFAHFEKSSSETVLLSETRYMRMLPDLSNAPEQFVQASPDFWRPKPPAAAKPKPKPPETAKPSQ